MPNPAVEEYEKIVDALRTAVRSPETANPTLLADDAAQYSEACAEINVRIRAAHALKAKGLRVEAVQNSMVDPDALRCFKILDFHESEAWRQLAVFWKWPPPPELELIKATELDSAHADLMVLDDLLRKDRRLNLARAPIEERAQVLRQLHAKETDDQSRENWRSRIMQIEGVRLKEIEADMDAAFERHDGARVNLLYIEINEEDWISPVPSLLTEKINQYRSQLYVDDVVGYLEGIVNKWEAAHSSQNVEQGEFCRNKWDHHQPQAGLTPNDPLSLRAQPLIEWMANSDTREKVKQQIVVLGRQLHNLMNHQAEPGEIDSIAAKIEVLGGTLTPEVRKRIQKSHDRVARGEKQRMFAIIVGAIILVLFILGMFGLLIYYDTQSGKNAGDRDEFKVAQQQQHQSLLSGQLDPADTFGFAEQRGRG
jgi:hypothetical protein